MGDQIGQIVFAHIMFFAIASGSVLFRATGNLAVLTPVNAFPFRRKSTIAPELLIVAEAVFLGYLRLLAAGNVAVNASFFVFAFGRQAAVATHLLIVTRAVTGGAGRARTGFGQT